MLKQKVIIIPRKNKAIVFKDLDTRLSIPTDGIIIKPPSNLIQNKKYYLDRINELEETNKKLKDIINSLADKKDELKYLYEFRNMFAGHCFKHNIRKTIIQCTISIRKDGCSFKDTCKERKKWNKLVQI